jgi:hypothetical protein
MCKYALVKLEQASQVQSFYNWLKSVAKHLFLTLIYPKVVNAVPNLAVLVGNTQSNISTPKAIHNIRSTGYPTPIKYLGLLLGNY